MAASERIVICRAVRDEAPGVRTFCLAPEDGGAFVFRAGQFVNLALTLADGPVERSFTIASPPTRGGLIELTVKAQADGRATRHLHDSVAPGARLTLTGPFGRFHLGDRLDRPQVFVSAGSGATPMAAMLRFLDDAGLAVPVHYLGIGRRPEDILFRDELEAIAARRPATRVDFLATAVAGRPDADRFRALLPQLAEADVFCCGPAGFMATVRQAHAAAGGAPERWHEEAFHPEASGTPDTAPDAAVAAAGDAPGPLLRFEPAGVEIAARPGETILEAGLRAGLPLKSSCRKGMCSTCRLRKLDGAVDMQQDGGLFDDEVEAGDILACCSRPLGPVRLAFP